MYSRALDSGLIFMTLPKLPSTAILAILFILVIQNNVILCKRKKVKISTILRKII